MKVYAAIAAVIAFLLFSLLIVKSERDSLALRLDMTEGAVEALESAAKKSRALLVLRDEIDKKYNEELENAKSENRRLRDAVDTSAKRLLVKASCPIVPGNTSASGISDAARPELHSSARQDYFDLRERIVSTEKRLAGLQAYVKNVCLAGGANE